MTIREYVTSKKEMSINEWLKQIALDGLKKHESVIIRCADDNNLITINNKTSVLDDLIGSITITNKIGNNENN